MSSFGEPELLDDLLDHFGSHNEERVRLIQRLQEFAAKRSVRVSFLSGDVHLAASGRLFTAEGIGSKHGFGHTVKPENDHRYMVEVVASAIANTPPPDGVVRLLNLGKKLERTDAHTAQEMMKLFRTDVTGKYKRRYKRFLPRRNWCAVDIKESSIVFTLNVERLNVKEDAMQYRIEVPNLVNVKK
jgi:hypothetical protein